MNAPFLIHTRVFLWQEASAWHFVRIPTKQSEEIKTLFSSRARGWGSIPVEVTVGNTTWETSIFPDKKSGTYLLPLKAAIRKKEGLVNKDEVVVRLVIRV